MAIYGVIRAHRSGLAGIYGQYEIPFESVNTDDGGASYWSWYIGRGYGYGYDIGPAIVFPDTANPGVIKYYAMKPNIFSDLVAQGSGIQAEQLYNAAVSMNAQQMLQAPTYQQAWLTQNPDYAEYWNRYGAWPVNNPQAQSEWFMRAAIGGMLTVAQQSTIAQSSGWQSFWNQTFPLIATSYIVGAMMPTMYSAGGAALKTGVAMPNWALMPKFYPGQIFSDILQNWEPTSYGY